MPNKFNKTVYEDRITCVLKALIDETYPRIGDTYKEYYRYFKVQISYDPKKKYTCAYKHNEIALTINALEPKKLLQHAIYGLASHIKYCNGHTKYEKTHVISIYRRLMYVSLDMGYFQLSDIIKVLTEISGTKGIAVFDYINKQIAINYSPYHKENILDKILGLADTDKQITNILKSHGFTYDYMEGLWSKDTYSNKDDGLFRALRKRGYETTINTDVSVKKVSQPPVKAVLKPRACSASSNLRRLKLILDLILDVTCSDENNNRKARRFFLKACTKELSEAGYKPFDYAADLKTIIAEPSVKTDRITIIKYIPALMSRMHTLYRYELGDFSKARYMNYKIPCMLLETGLYTKKDFQGEMFDHRTNGFKRTFRKWSLLKRLEIYILKKLLKESDFTSEPVNVKTSDTDEKPTESKAVSDPFMSDLPDEPSLPMSDLPDEPPSPYIETEEKLSATIYNIQNYIATLTADARLKADPSDISIRIIVDPKAEPISGYDRLRKRIKLTVNKIDSRGLLLTADDGIIEYMQASCKRSAVYLIKEYIYATVRLGYLTKQDWMYRIAALPPDSKAPQKILLASISELSACRPIFTGLEKDLNEHGYCINIIDDTWEKTTIDIVSEEIFLEKLEEKYPIDISKACEDSDNPYAITTVKVTKKDAEQTESGAIA